MRLRSMVALLIIAGVFGIIAALWSGSGSALGPVRMGEKTLSSGIRDTMMVLTLIGGIGALITAFTVKVYGTHIFLPSQCTVDPVGDSADHRGDHPVGPAR